MVLCFQEEELGGNWASVSRQPASLEKGQSSCNLPSYVLINSNYFTRHGDPLDFMEGDQCSTEVINLG